MYEKEPMELIPNKSKEELNALFTDYWRKTEDVRVQRAQKMWNWYFSDEDEVREDVEEALSKAFRESTRAQMNIRVFNVVERVVNRLAKVYKKPAQRCLDGGTTYDTTGGVLKEVQSEDDKTYQMLLKESSLTKRVRQAEPLLILFNTILVQPVWRKDYLDYTIHTPAWTVVNTDPNDYLTPESFYYATWATIKGELQQVLVYWSATEHYWIDRNGNRIVPDGMLDTSNPYGIMPAALARIKDGIDFWGEGKWNLVDGNEEVCVQLTNILYTALFQTHGQMVGINTGISGAPSIGCDSPILIESRDPSIPAPSITFESANPMIPEVQGLIDWMLKTLQNIEGLSGNEMTLDPTMASGISKIQDSAYAVEAREDMISTLEEFEHELFEISRVVWNYHNPGKKISDKAVFSVKFAEQKVMKTTDEKIKEREAALKLGIASRVDFILEDNPTFTREQAERKLEQIFLEERKAKDEFGLMDNMSPDVTETPGTPKPAGVAA